MKSLLNKSHSQFVICTLIILLLAVPAFYLLTKYYYAEELEDVIQMAQSGKHQTHFDLEEDILTGLVIQYILVFVILSLSLLFTLRFITRKLWSPFNDTLKKIEQFNLKQENIPQFKPTNTTEFVRLNEAVSQLMRKDKKIYQSQKEFTENASHELQTPIAIMQSKLDLLLQEELNQRQMYIICELYHICHRMSKLNKNLLMLAKIENAQYIQKEKIDLVPFLKKQLVLYKELQPDIIIRLNSNDNPIIVNANIVLLESLINNLVINAIRHAHKEREIDIETDSHFFLVSNDSDGKPLDEKRLFHRFQQPDDKKNGNGLGLSIVKAICDYHNWNILYSFENNRHCFKIVF